MRPVPDPTEMTTEALKREIAGLKELLEARTNASVKEMGYVKELIEMRLAEMDKAIKLVHEDRQYFPNRIDEKITAVAAVNDARFRNLDTRFEERDSRTEAHNASSKMAVDAALQAAKEAVSKSEMATVKQIDQQSQMLASISKALDEKIDDVKDRLTRLEGAGEGQIAQRTTSQASSSFALAIISFIIGTMLTVGGVALTFLLRK